MFDALDRDIRRGDQLIDQWGHLFVVTGVSPKNVHLQDAKTGRRFRQAGKAISRTISMLRARGDLGNQQARRDRWVKEVIYERGLSLKSGS
ncbi:hypothetical protein LCGC14_1595550 [marine sediment metagenome]|uniref:Uncharacterized protein n=1 Tax=marine sediment metagenome TaxID=412755 RepID=A0A0F9LCX2_9ZZZZ